MCIANGYIVSDPMALDFTFGCAAGSLLSKLQLLILSGVPPQLPLDVCGTTVLALLQSRGPWLKEISLEHEVKPRRQAIYPKQIYLQGF